MKKKFIFILSAISLLGIYFMMFPNLNLPYRGYEFRVGASPQSDSSYYIRNYSLNYDFEKERGKISFRFFDKDGHGNNFYMEVPEQLQIIDYSLSDPNILDCNINEEQRWHIFCEYKERLKEQISFVINISGKDVSEEKFQPNGLFIFGDIRDFTLSDNKGYEKNNVLLNFNLGNRYKCKENCFIKEMSSENLDYYLDENNLIVYSYQGENNVILPHFRLNTYNFHWQVWSGAIFVFTISLLASSIVLFFQEINLRKLKPFILKMKSLIKGKLSEKDKRINLAIFTGLVGGLMVYFSQIAIEEIIKISGLPNHYSVKIFGALIVAIFIFVIFAITSPLRNLKMSPNSPSAEFSEKDVVNVKEDS